ncbi:hypothetical protein HS125_05245 [bacterium]|nr:hypothetical protein [bacterium]
MKRSLFLVGLCGAMTLAGAVELAHTLKSSVYGFQMRYPAGWTEASAYSDVVTYYAATALPPVPQGSPNARYVVAGPEADGFRPTLNVQPRGLYGAIDEKLRRETVESLRAMAGRVAGASLEMIDDRFETLPAGPALVLDYTFNDASGRRLASRHWVFSGQINFLLTFTDTIEGFAVHPPLAEAMVASFAMFDPPPPESYEDVINFWITLALVVSVGAGGAAYVLYRRARRVEEHPEGEPIVPEGLAAGRSARGES